MKTKVQFLPTIYRNLLITFLFGLTVLTGCQSGKSLQPTAASFSQYPDGGGLYVSAAFGPDGRLWRVVPEQQFIYVDSSSDFGKTFSHPIRINSESRKIKASAEGRPRIAVDRDGRVYVAYTAQTTLPNSVFVSISDQHGQNFSTPFEISESAAAASSYEPQLALSPQNRVYLFWHDERDRADYRIPGNSIYYAQLDPNAGRTPNYRAVESQMECECCRIAVDFAEDGTPLVLTRFIYGENTRDHGLIRIDPRSHHGKSRRVTFDDWEIEACPEHGPALSLSPEGKLHMVWFTLGNQHRGLFYANSENQGLEFSNPTPIGNPANLPGHADVITQDEHVALAWEEFDGNSHRILLSQSKDFGTTWSPAQVIAKSASEADYPFLLSDGRTLYLSWNTQAEGYRLLPLD